MPTERETKTRHHQGPGEPGGMTSRSNRCAGVWDPAGLAQWKDDTKAHKEMHNGPSAPNPEVK